MKQAKRLTRRQKILLTKYKLNPDNWLCAADDGVELEIIHRLSNKRRRLAWKR